MRTPGPWRWFTDHKGDPKLPHMKFLVGANGQGLGHTVGLTEPEDTENADFILLAVNRFEELLAAAEETREFLEGWRAVSPNHVGLLSRLEAAIAKAKEAP